MANLGEGDRASLLPVTQLANIRLRLAEFFGSLQKMGFKTIQGFLDSLHSSDHLDKFFAFAILSLDKCSEILGMAEFAELERQYAVQ